MIFEITCMNWYYIIEADKSTEAVRIWMKYMIEDGYDQPQEDEFEIKKLTSDNGILGVYYGCD